MADTSTEILRKFIADENRAFAERRQGKFWPSNHYSISPLAAKAAKFLDADECVTFFFHYLRVAGIVPAVRQKDLPLLIDAYRRLLPHFDLSGIIQMARRPTMLFIFGFDEGGSLPSGETDTAAALKQRIKLVSQVGNYTSQPAQRDKKARFALFADQASRVLETLQHLEYRHDRRYREDNYDITNLNFWGMVFLCLLNETTRTEVLTDMVEGRYDLLRRAEQMTMLYRYVEAVLPDVGPDENEFLTLANRLKDFCLARRNATESLALVKELELNFNADEDWTIYISIPLRGSQKSALIAPTVVKVTMRPEPDYQWELMVKVEGRGMMSEREKYGISQNDLNLPGLGRGNLRTLPQWLQQIRERYALDFDVEAADIRVGRNRSTVKLLAEWLAG